jgi:FlaA1/EpsC-like NDP-sugar epimerase
MRNRYVLLADVLAVAIAATGTFVLRFGWLFLDERREFPWFLGAAVVVKICVFLRFGLYRRFWRYAGFWDLMAVAHANTAASVLFGLVMSGLRVTSVIDGLSRSVLPIDWLLALVLTTGVRASVRVIAESTRSSGSPEGLAPKKVVIVGAGDAGTLVARELQKPPGLGMTLVGFIDDDRTKQGKWIYGVPVLGPISSLPKIFQEQSIAEAIIAMPTVGGTTVRTVVETCQASGVPSQVVPGIHELLGGHVTVSRLRKVNIGDLLRRSQVTTAVDGGSYLRNGTVVITGAGGSIGAELCRQVAHQRPNQMVIVGHGENSIFEIALDLHTRFPDVAVDAVIADVRDRDRIARVFVSARPDIVFHVAAHKHVPLMEANPCEAIKNNVAGSRNVVDAALASDVQRLVLMSTDKAAAPSNVMGATKRVAELIVRQAANRSGRAYIVVRFGNVLGSRGSVVPTFKKQIERGGPVTVTHFDVRRYFMTIPEAVHLILHAGGIGQGGELFVLDMGEPVLLRDLAADMIRLSGFSTDEIPVVYSGLRPGEKLEERLWEEGATISPTQREDISVVREREDLPAEQLDGMIDRLLDAAARDDGQQMLKLLGECIPTARLTARGRSPHS